MIKQSGDRIVNIGLCNLMYERLSFFLYEREPNVKTNVRGATMFGTWRVAEKFFQFKTRRWHAISFN